MQKTKRNIREIFPNGFLNISEEETRERLFKEIVIHSLKTDISEELDRLKMHLKKMCLTINSEKTAIGKKIEHLCQEINRETNTIGTKTSNIKISHDAIEIKLIIEKIREQSQNIE